MSRLRKIITSTRGNLHVTDDKLNVSYEEVLMERGQGECQAAGREKNRLNGTLKEILLIKHMITVLTDEKQI